MTVEIRIGTAGWSIPRAAATRFGPTGTHLQRYAGVFSCVEINSSFYRGHAAATYARWRESTPPDFRFAVKMPRAITHELKLRDAQHPLTEFFAQVEPLGDKRGPILMQLPPSLALESDVATAFLRFVRARYAGQVVCEPRHPTWFTAEATSLLERYDIARVAADPPLAPGADAPGGSARVVYYRLHGSPRMYWSKYDESYLAALVSRLRDHASAETVWCIFDNTAMGTAIENAFELQALLDVR